jgi:trimeric autotransporter adhesin
MPDMKIVFKKFLIQLMVFILILTPSIANAIDVIIVDPTPDIAPPVLTSLSISSDQVSPENPVKISAGVSDELSGVKRVYISYKKPSGSSKGTYLYLNQTTQKYEGTISIGTYDEAGVWVPSYLILTDNKDNDGYVYDDTSNSSGQKFDFDPYKFSVSGVSIPPTTPEPTDKIPPVLNSIITNVSQVKGPGTVKLIADVSDNDTGVNSVYANYLKPSGRSYSLNLYLNSISGKYEGSISIDQYEEIGNWKLNYVRLGDKAGNYKYIYDSVLNPTSSEKQDFSNCKVYVEGITPDLIAPSLDDLSRELIQNTNNTALIKLFAEVNDDLSGVRTNSVYAVYQKPSGKTFTVSFNRSGSTGKYEASIPIDKYDETGTWKLRYISVEDNKGNSRTINDRLGTKSLSTWDFSPYYFTVRGVITIPPPVRSSIGLSFKEINMVPGEIQQLTVTMKWSDNTSEVITSTSTGTKYTSSRPEDVSIDANGKISVSTNAKPGTVTIQASNSGLSEQCEITIPGEEKESYIVVNPLSVNLSSGQKKQLNIVAKLEDGTTKDVTNDIETTYLSSNTSLVNVTNNGLISIPIDAKPGSAKISINYNGLIAETMVTFTGPPTVKSIAMTPATANINYGEKIQLSLRTTMSDGTTNDVTNGSSGTAYTTSDSARATVDSNGLIQILDNAKSGTVTIKAFNNSLIAQSIITINGIPELTGVQVTPASITLKQGESQNLKVEASYSNGTIKDVTDKSTYKSGNSSLAKIDLNGLITVPEDSTGGTVNIAVTFDGKTTTSKVIVPSKPVLESLTFNPTKLTLKPGKTQQLEVQANYSDESTTDVTSRVVYESSDESLATVDESGLITVNKEAKGGIVYIRGAYGGKGGVTTVSIPTYTPPTVINLEFSADKTFVNQGDSTQVKVLATYVDGSTEDVTVQALLNSSNTTLATVEAETGVVTISEGATGGTVNIRGIYGGKGGSVTITIPSLPTVSTLSFKPDKLTLENGESSEIKVTAIYTDGTTEDVTSKALLSSSNTSQATVDPSSGIVDILEGSTGGTVYIRGSYGGKGGAATITIPAPPSVTSLTFDPSTKTVKPGDTIQLNVTANYSDGYEKAVTLESALKSTNTNLAIVDPSTGLVEIPQQAPNGTVYIQGVYGGKGGSTKFTVSKPYVTGITFTPGQVTIKKGEPLSVKVDANFSDGSSENVTAQTTFSSSNSAVATVDSSGNVTVPESSKGGTVYIRGTYGGKGGAATVTVLEPPIVTNLLFTASSNTLDKGESVQVNVTSVYSDGTSKDVTGEVLFSSSNVNLATVDASGVVTLAETAKSGTVYIRGVYEGKGGSATLIIPPQPYIVSLVFDPLTTTLSKGSSLAMKVTANYSNGDTEDVTSKIVFTSSNTNIATVDGTGLVTVPLTSSGGTVYIRGSYGGKGTASTVKVQ